MAVVQSTNPIQQRYRQLLSTVGKNVAHGLFPKDFEAYFISMELTDSTGSTTESFITFPVQPEQISEMAPRITNIKKSAGGVIAIGTETFIPRDIEIKGNFGSGFRFVIGNNFINGDLISFKKNSGNDTDLGYTSFSNTVKTGYGMVKSIEEMLDSADLLDDFGKPKRLYLYNTILGNNYLVKVKNFIHSQNQAQNMIPQYTLQLTAIAPLNTAQFAQLGGSLGNAMGIDVLNKGANILAKSIKSKLRL